MASRRFFLGLMADDPQPPGSPPSPNVSPFSSAPGSPMSGIERSHPAPAQRVSDGLRVSAGDTIVMDRKGANASPEGPMHAMPVPSAHNKNRGPLSFTVNAIVALQTRFARMIFAPKEPDELSRPHVDHDQHPEGTEQIQRPNTAMIPARAEPQQSQKKARTGAPTRPPAHAPRVHGPDEHLHGTDEPAHIDDGFAFPDLGSAGPNEGPHDPWTTRSSHAWPRLY